MHDWITLAALEQDSWCRPDTITAREAERRSSSTSVMRPITEVRLSAPRRWLGSHVRSGVLNGPRRPPRHARRLRSMAPALGGLQRLLQARRPDRGADRDDQPHVVPLLRRL